MTQPLPWYATAAALLQAARRRWQMALGLSLTGAVVGGVTAFLLPSYYRSEAAFQAEATTQVPLSGALAGLASQFGGLQIGGTQGNPYLFADLLVTDGVLRHVIQGTYPWRGQSASLAAVYGYGDEPEGLREYKTIRRLRKAITTDVNIRTMIVRFSVEARSPELAKAIAETLLTDLNQANIALRQLRAAAEQSFTTARSDQARLELAAAESSLADFSQRNRVITGSPGLQMEESRLRRAVDMAQQVYVQLRLQAEQAGVQAVRNTPAITVVDPPVLPVKRSWPHRTLSVALGLLIGLAAATGRLLTSA